MIRRSAYPRTASALVRTLVAVAAAVLVVSCGGPAKPTVLPPVAPSDSPAPDSTSVPTMDESPDPEASASPQPSRKPTPKPPVPSVAAVIKDTRYYIRHLPTFDAPPAPEPVDVDAATSSPVWFKVPTTQRVAFLTIDDGMVQHPMALPLLKASGVRVTLFLTLNYAKKNPAYFKALQEAGAVIENHTIDHASLKGKSYDFQKNEICHTADEFATMFGRRPTLFRPPYGEYDATTLKVARECGQKVVFYWTETVDKGKVRYQSSNHTIQPGHIVLMHFRPAFGDDFTSALNHMKSSGVTPALLEDYVKGACENSCKP